MSLNGMCSNAARSESYQHSDGLGIGRKLFVCAAPQTVYSFGDALRWTTQLAQGLAYLHAHRPLIIHRDLKLENCLLTGAITCCRLRSVHACSQACVC